MDQSLKVKLSVLLERHEGKRNFPYLCTAGKTTIGIGRNLTDRGISDYEIQIMFDADVNYFISSLVKNYPWFESLSENRQVALIDLAFNIGIKGFHGFKRMRMSLQQGKWIEASIQLLDSKYAKQVPRRANELARIIVSDEL